ncbi:MFS transporter [Micromonospora coerulea]|uniref:MFS transporter n=1 Tax=Micromonospora coerulea TaxID=47856 RepID=UPI0031FA25EB
MDQVDDVPALLIKAPVGDLRQVHGDPEDADPAGGRFRPSLAGRPGVARRRCAAPARGGIFIRETLGSSTTMYGLVTGSWTLGIVLGGWLFARLARRLTDDGALLGAGLALLGGCCLAVLGSAAVPAAMLLVPIWLAGGVANGGDNVFNNLLLARRVPEASRGRAFAVFGAAVQGAGMAGYLIGGLLLELAAPRPLVAGAGVAGLLVVAAVVAPVRRAVRAERAARLPAAGRPAAELATPAPSR